MLYRPFRTVMSPWREIDRLQREMNRLFAEFPATFGDRLAPAYPAMNVWTNDEGAVVTAELPGVSVDDINISVEGDTLTLNGSRQPEKLQDGEKYHRRERKYGRFTRAFQLPFQVDADRVEALFEKGILHISLPRAEADKPKHIPVKTGNAR